MSIRQDSILPDGSLLLPGFVDWGTRLSDGDVRSVGRALGLLLAFSDQRPEITLAEPSHELHLSVSTTHHLLNTLESYRFIEQDEAPANIGLGWL